MRPPPLTLYVHFPWCVKKCPYCDFNSHPLRAPLAPGPYVTRLLEDLAVDAPMAGPRVLGSIFLGGGTPSLFPPPAIAELLAGIRAHLTLADDAEVTLEANPGTLEHGPLADYRDAGVNRLSLGVQSFDDTALARLGRIHGGREAAALAEHALGIFPRVNLDLMYGLPGQRVRDAMADLERAIAIGTTHLSWYQLTIEPKTEFARRTPVLPADDTLGEIEAEGQARLADAGFTRYEVSAYAHRGAECRHNRNYWEFGDYLGIGAGAHGKLSDETSNRIRRTCKPASPRRYLAAEVEALRTETEVPAAERPGEFMLNALRLVAGVAPETFEARTGLPLDALEPERGRLVAAGLMAPGALELTPRGFELLDGIVARFL